MTKSAKVWSLPIAGGAIGAFAALMLAAPAVHADPEPPVPPPPLPGPPLPEPEQQLSTQAADTDPALPPPPPAEVQHLSSPENLPPGTTNVPLDPGQGRTTSYLRDLWHAVQTQEISGRDMILLLTQRPLDPHAVPTNGLPAGPQAPAGPPLPDAPAPDAPPADAAAPAPAPLLPEPPPPPPELTP